MQLKNYIREAAEESAKLTKTELMLELREWQIENTATQTRVIRETMEEERKRWFDELPPHEHISHHAEVDELLKARNSAINSLFKRGIQGVVVLALVTSLGININPAILGKEKTTKSSTAVETTKVE